MKTTLILLLAMAGVATAQTTAVTKNPNTDELKGSLVVPSNQFLQVDGTLQTSQSPVLFGRSSLDIWSGFEAFTSILSSESNRHGLLVRTSNVAGAAIIGISETGAAAGKFFQFNSYASPTVWIGRDPNTWPWGDPPLSPTLVVTSPANWTQTPVALFKKNQNDVVLSIGSDGSVKAPFQDYTDVNALTTRGFVEGTFARRFGVTNGAEAEGGEVGEYYSSEGTSTDLVTATAKTVHTLTLPPGDWDVQGTVTYSLAAGTAVSYVQQGVSGIADTFDATNAYTAVSSAITNAGPTVCTTPVVRMNLTGTAVIHLVARAGFTTSTLNASGFLRARRVH